MTRGPFSAAITGALGLASEAYASIKNKDKAEPGPGFLEDEDEWRVDDAAAEEEEEENAQGTELTSATSASQWLPPPPSANAQLSHPLEYAVIVPQRRPKTKSRGFVRAYAPVLRNCDVDQEIFMKFLAGFDNAIKAQSLFIVANIAVGAGVTAATAFVGNNPLIDIGAFMVHTTVEVGRRAYIAKKYNHYLLDMNEKFFQPRGLYALIMAYKPGSADAAAIVDLQTNVALSAATGGEAKGWFGVSSGNTYDESSMPMAAPLVFPQAKDDQKGSVTKVSHFFSDYSDRRAQALWAANNPDSSLNVQEPQKFASKWSDPNHPVNHAGPLGVLTGGKFSRDAKKYEEQKAKNLAENRAGDDSGAVGGLKGLKRKLQEPTLYLMIVNMPSEEEMATVAELKQRMDREKEERGST